MWNINLAKFIYIQPSSLENQSSTRNLSSACLGLGDLYSPLDLIPRMQTITHQMKISAHDFHAPETRNFNLHSMSLEQEICNYLFNFLKENNRPRSNHYSTLIFPRLAQTMSTPPRSVVLLKIATTHKFPHRRIFIFKEGGDFSICKWVFQTGLLKIEES